jgi:hypothetical protein
MSPLMPVLHNWLDITDGPLGKINVIRVHEKDKKIKKDLKIPGGKSWPSENRLL